MEYHLYADDTKLYVSVDPGNKADVSSSLENLEESIADIELWVTNNCFVSTKEGKTNIIYIASTFSMALT